MQRTAGACGFTSTRHDLSLAENEVSGAHALRCPNANQSSLPCDEETTDRETTDLEALRLELSRMQAALEARDQEVERLKQQLNGTESVSTSGIALKEPNSVSDEAEPQQENPSLCDMPESPTAVSAPPTYPVLQRVAVTFGTSSLPPPCDRDSAPPSQRRAPRRPCEIELEFTEDTHFYAGLTQDISQGGVFIATYHLAPIGTRLKLAFDLPDGTHIQTRGEVRWRRDNATSCERLGMGVAFLDLEADSLVAIGRFCQDRPPLYMEL